MNCRGSQLEAGSGDALVSALEQWLGQLDDYRRKAHEWFKDARTWDECRRIRFASAMLDEASRLLRNLSRHCESVERVQFDLKWEGRSQIAQELNDAFYNACVALQMLETGAELFFERMPPTKASDIRKENVAVYFLDRTPRRGKPNRRKEARTFDDDDEFWQAYFEYDHSREMEEQLSAFAYISQVNSDIRAVVHILKRIAEQQQTTPPDDETQQSEPKKRAWRPPKGYIGSKEIEQTYKVPRSTLQGWQNRDCKPAGKLDGRVKRDPQTGESYYPRTWFLRRFENYKPKQEMP